MFLNPKYLRNSRRAVAPIKPAFGSLCFVRSLALLFLIPLFARAAGPNIASPAFQRIRADYEAQEKILRTAKTEKLKALLAEFLGEAKRLLAEKTRAGNVAGMAAAREAIALFEHCREELDKQGDFVLPEKIRRELQDMLARCTEKKKAIDAECSAALEQLKFKSRDQLAARLAEQGFTSLGEDELSRLLQQLLGGKPTDSEPSSEPSIPASEPTSPATTNETRKLETESRVLASSSSQEVDWVPIARWYAGVSAIEIIRIPVIERFEREHRRLESESLGQPFETIYEPIRALTPGPGYFFRVKSIPGREVAEVLEWPSANNNWTMIVRARPSGEVPSRHGLEIEVGFPGAKDLALIHGEQEEEMDLPEDNLPRVRVTLKTDPEGAYVYVDGRPLRQGAAFLQTPCVVPLTTKPHNIRMRKFGFKDGAVDGFVPQEGGLLSLKLEPDPRYASGVITVSAKRTWQPSKFRVEKGDRIVIKATGKWRCGSGGEWVDAEGYPNDKQFFRYYLNPQMSPRQKPGANYGALLMRIGANGPVYAVGTKFTTTASEEGELYFDINEATDTKLRRDNDGTLSVEIKKAPGSDTGGYLLEKESRVLQTSPAR